MSKQASRDRAQKRRGQQRRQTQLIIIGVVALAALMLVGLLITLNLQGANAGASIDYAGIPQSIDTTGAIGLALGRGDAPNTLVEYSDFSCPHCHDLVEPMQQIVAAYVRAGALRIVYKPVTFVGGANSEVAARGAICAARQGKFGQMEDQIWAFYASRSARAYDQPAMESLASKIGLDAAQFHRCFASSETTAAIQSVSDEVLEIGVDSTPTVFLNGERLNFGGPEGLIPAVSAKLGQQPANSSTEASPAQ